MKVTSARNLDVSIAKLPVASPVAVALKSSAAKIVLTLQPLPQVVTAKNPLLGGAPELGKSLGRSIPGLGNNGLPGGLGKTGLPSGLGRASLGGFGEAGLGGFGQAGVPGGFSIPGGIGRSGGPALKMPGADRMDGDFGFGVFGKGTWDYDSRGLHGSANGGATVGGYGLGINDRGQLGAATGDANGGSVTSLGDAKAGAAKAAGGGSASTSGSAPEGMDWSKGTRIKDNATNNAPANNAPNTEGPNDLGPSTNDPATDPKKEDDTAVAKNDTPKNNEAGKPNPFAMPNPEGDGGGSPRSSVTLASRLFTPNPEDAGGGTPRSRFSLLRSLFMPNPEEAGGGTPRSVVANIAIKLR